MNTRFNTQYIVYIVNIVYIYISLFIYEERQRESSSEKCVKRFLVDGNERETDVCVRKSRVEFVSSKEREREPNFVTEIELA